MNSFCSFFSSSIILSFSDSNLFAEVTDFSELSDLESLFKFEETALFKADYFLRRNVRSGNISLIMMMLFLLKRKEHFLANLDKYSSLNS